MFDEQLTFGIDLGIGSCGWAVLRYPQASDEGGVIEGLGSWCFDVPETDKTRTPTNQIRRDNRLLRRVTRRRRNRMAEIRHLFYKRGLLSSANRDALKRPGIDPWELRARGLDKPLKPVEFAVVLGHIAKRRGFKSAAKPKAKNASDDDKKMLAALETTKERLARYRTVGEMFARDPDFSTRRRNRNGMFDRTAGREDLIDEASKLFVAQRRFGQNFASQELEEVFKAIAFRQLPMQDSEKLVGPCPFELEEKRASKLAPSFERFRLLTRLINLRIQTAKGERSLTQDELLRVTADLGKTARLTVKKVRGLIGLEEHERFTAIKLEDESRDIVARTGDAMSGTFALRKALGEILWAEICLDQLDAVAHALSFFETEETIRENLEKLELGPDMLGALLVALEAGSFVKFKGAGHISAKACRKLLPFLEQGLRYDKACCCAGYDHAASSLLNYDHAVTNKTRFNALVAEMSQSIANPIARKSLTEGLKQLWAMRNRWGLPGSIHIELAREVGNSVEKRYEIERQINENTEQREREREHTRELLGITDVDGDTLLRYRLWKEQGGKCPYTGKDIHITQIIATDSSVQVDHILPWSRFGDDSFNNKALCLAGANQRKKGQTPYEWFSLDKSPDEWELFVQRIETSKDLRGFKKRNYLLKNASEREEQFRNRNLNDTRYAARLLAEAAKLFYPPGERQEKGGNRRVFTRPGALTAALRHAWGLEALKKTSTGKRVPDDRHHALDALAVAAIGEGAVQRLTRSYQESEQQGLGRPLRHVACPWPGFRRAALAAYDGVFVARPERRRARGEGHAATIRQVETRESKTVVYERKAVSALKGTDLDRVKDPERNGAVIKAIRTWIEAGKPADALPKSPQGDIITKVRLLSSKKTAVMVRGGTADRGEMVRVDVFSKPNRRGKDEWYLVPIYPHQVMNRKVWPNPPMRSVVGNKDESEWMEIGSEHIFRFSLYPRSYIEIIRKDGSILSGYFSGLDRSNGAIAISDDKNLNKREKGIGTKTLLKISKYSVDRFGARVEVKKEVRTWRGGVCISHSPPG